MADYAQDAVLITADGSLKRSFAKYGHCSERAYSPRPAEICGLRWEDYDGTKLGPRQAQPQAGGDAGTGITIR